MEGERREKEGGRGEGREEGDGRTNPKPAATGLLYSLSHFRQTAMISSGVENFEALYERIPCLMPTIYNSLGLILSSSTGTPEQEEASLHFMSGLDASVSEEGKSS